MRSDWKYLHRVFILVLSVCLFYHDPFSLCAFSLSDLSLEEKVGQVLMVHFHGQEANEEARRLIQESYVGGVIYYSWANGLRDPEQVQHLSQSLQQLAKQTPHAIPLLIAIDHEGGRVSRLKQGFTLFPGNYALGQTEEWQWGTESAWRMGQELKAVGISLNLAPVVDVYTQPANPVIGIRAFSSDPLKVALWGKYALQGYKQAGVIAALKHFPGHGDVTVDSHEALPLVAKKREVLEEVEIFPFRKLASQAEVIMTAHLFIPALDAQECVTFSKKIVQDFLRNDLGFQGIAMTDSLAMEGILSQSPSVEEAALRSLEAGHDLILLGGKQLLASQQGLELTPQEIKRVHHFLVEAVKQGRLSEKRLDEAVNRLLSLKQRYGLFDFRPLEASWLKTQVNTPSHRALAQQIARRALRVVKKGEHLPLALHSQRLLIVAPDCLKEDLMQTAWSSLGSQAQILYFKGFNPDKATIEEIRTVVDKDKPCVYFAYNTWQFGGQRELFQMLVQQSAYTIALAVRDPVDSDHLNAADIILCTFSPLACSLQAAFDYLMEKR